MPKPPVIRKTNAASLPGEKRVEIKVNLDVAPAIRAFMKGLSGVLLGLFLLTHPETAGQGMGKAITAILTAVGQ